ncbi:MULTISPECIES: EamA family transporter [unclassified Paenibacillus]|uniref:EamA family transporter n=1 Tax=unclassified Paenibacillus TaxID=185978 RepID=UPI001C0F4FED|nr:MULTISPECIES: EamA family transporter [unclassified Paenibacillus]MBU5444924.1 EamA family transporter [Paenibacillus sp. MSJ-34]CAH0120673.1 4-amino-4-deoxy-L-arabinose-phosphoundecaprenol flippase subunit ArnE [Paenibacillus sp. CECT 9249]
MISNLPLFLLPVMTLFGALGSVFFKKFSLHRKIVTLLIGCMFYGLGALLNIYLLRELPYTVVMPANALTFIWALLLAKWVFKETIGMFKIAGVACIVSGLLLLIL